MSVLRIRWQPGSVTFEVQRGERLLDALDARHDAPGPRVHLPTACRSANCGTCRVRVISGEAGVIPADPWEQSVLEQHGAEPDERLGCQLCFALDTNCDEVTLERLP
jgi:ferredoxin